MPLILLLSGINKPTTSCRLCCDKSPLTMCARAADGRILDFDKEINPFLQYGGRGQTAIDRFDAPFPDSIRDGPECQGTGRRPLTLHAVCFDSFWEGEAQLRPASTRADEKLALPGLCVHPECVAPFFFPLAKPWYRLNRSGHRLRLK